MLRYVNLNVLFLSRFRFYFFFLFSLFFFLVKYKTQHLLMLMFQNKTNQNMEHIEITTTNTKCYFSKTKTFTHIPFNSTSEIHCRTLKKTSDLSINIYEQYGMDGEIIISKMYCFICIYVTLFKDQSEQFEIFVF